MNQLADVVIVVGYVSPKTHAAQSRVFRFDVECDLDVENVAPVDLLSWLQARVVHGEFLRAAE
jgi:hypothetical protein